MSDVQLKYCYRCKKCNLGPCFVTVSNEALRPRACPIVTWGEEVHPVWKSVISKADYLLDLLQLRDQLNDDWIAERQYPDWFYSLTGTCHAESDILAWQLRNQLEDDESYGRRLLYGSLDEDSETAKFLKQHKKSDLVLCAAEIGFVTGLLFSEWRRKETGLDDIELYEDD